MIASHHARSLVRSAHPPGRDLALVVLLLSATSWPSPAEGNPAMVAMKVLMISPALSADGRTVAMHSHDPTGTAGAAGSLVFFDGSGKELRRLPLVPPARDLARATQTYAAADLALTRGGYKRMGRVAITRGKDVQQRRPGDPPPSFAATFTQGEHTFAIEVTTGKVVVEVRRGTRTYSTTTIPFRTPTTRCAKVTGYSVSPTKVGFDLQFGLLAFSVLVEADGSTCFSHEYLLKAWRSVKQ
jgi:hypothetical protein